MYFLKMMAPFKYAKYMFFLKMMAPFNYTKFMFLFFYPLLLTTRYSNNQKTENWKTTLKQWYYVGLYLLQGVPKNMGIQ